MIAVYTADPANHLRLPNVSPNPLPIKVAGNAVSDPIRCRQKRQYSIL